ncbi:MAG: glycosyltransferase [Candidatus Binatia bacterium]
MWLRIAAKCASTTRVDTLAVDSSADPIQWVRERVDAFCSEGVHGRLYICIRQLPDPMLAGALGWVAADGRLEPVVVAPGSTFTSRAHLEVLQRSDVRALYVTLHAATATSHDARTGEPGSWRRALGVLITAPQVIPRVRVGVHLLLSPATVDDLPGILRLIRKVRASELLLWDAGCPGMEMTGVEPSTAVRALDLAVTIALRLGVRIRLVGFERARTVVAPIAATACVATGAIIELLRNGIPLPSAGAGLLATDGKSAPILEAAPTGRAIAQLALELAAARRPLLDLPACLGGPPPEHGRARPDGVKVDACRQCPIDARCSGVPKPLMTTPGLREEIQPPRHWLAMPEHARVLVLCPVVSDRLYGATFFSLARWLTRLGAHVDVVTPWATHADIPSSFPELQRMGRPEGASEVENCMSEGPVDRYDLIVTPDPKVTHPLVVNRCLPDGTRLAVTDFHILGGMDKWVRDLRAPARRAEEGGWWPSDQIVLYSACPGYAPLYTRYGVPMRQVAWQPYALDPGSFPVELPATEGTSIISAGHHRRDLDTLLSAAARLGPDVHPIDLFAPGQAPQVPPQIRFHGTVATSDFCSAVGRSRFMVVPLLEDPYNAAGITAMVTAIMCGRPVVATATAASRDYVTDGVNGLLVPPGDPQGMAEAIERLDTDTALLTTLAAGARDAAGTLTTEAWARALLHGSRTYDAEHWMWTKWPRRRVHPCG